MLEIYSKKAESSLKLCSTTRELYSNLKYIYKNQNILIKFAQIYIFNILKAVFLHIYGS